jgi:Cytochrome c oxidase subunit IV
VSEVDQQTPPVGEEVHLPGPSLLPLLSAVAVTLMVVGLTIGWYLSIIGLILFVVTTVMWIRDTRRDVESLPEEHH